MSTIFFFLFGILIGSFLNVVIFRLQTEESIGGRSHCRDCKSVIRWYDNIPVLSYLILGGKCRHCVSIISKQYPCVELATGVLFALIGQYIFHIDNVASYGPTVFYLGLVAMLAVIFVYDLSTMYIPMIMVWIALAWTVIYYSLSTYAGYASTVSSSAVVQFFTPLPQSLTVYIASAFGAFLFFWILVAVSKETWMGMGDAYLAILVGLIAGFPGTLWTLTFSFGAGALIGIALVAFGKKGMKSQVPFAPFMTLGLLAFIVLPKIFPQLQYYLMW